jgi:hypothetical protein
MTFIQEKSKEEDREKLGEKEETIPPDYRLEGAKVNRLFSCFVLIRTEFHIYKEGMGEQT